MLIFEGSGSHVYMFSDRVFYKVNHLMETAKMEAISLCMAGNVLSLVLMNREEELAYCWEEFR